MRKFGALLLSGVFLFSFASSGCSRSSLLPARDEVLVFPLAMDLAYLRALDAVDAHPDWDFEFTEKEKGLIHLRNLRYSSWADADLRTATIVLKRVGDRKTSVAFAPGSQAVVGGNELMGLIKEYLTREASQVAAKQ